MKFPSLLSTLLVSISFLYSHQVQAVQDVNPKIHSIGTVIANNLLNPRGFTFGPDGALYVAESGDFLTNEVTTYYVPGQISRINCKGKQTILADNLYVSPDPFGGTISAASVAFIGKKLYAIISLPGSPLGPGMPSGVYLVENGGVTLIADLAQFNTLNPPDSCLGTVPGCACANSCPANLVCPGGDDQGLSDPYDMVAYKNKLYITDGNRDVILVVDPSQPLYNNVAKFADLSCFLNGARVVPTGIALGPDKAFYVTNFGGYPEAPGSAYVFKIKLDGTVKVVSEGQITLGMGIAVASDGTIYVSEFAQNFAVPPPFLGPGRIVQIRRDGTLKTVVDGLWLPGIIRIFNDQLYTIVYTGLPVPLPATGGLGQVMKVCLY